MIKFASSVLLLTSAIAGAQTVSVGSTSSSTNGNTTTITVPVSVAVPPTTNVAATPMASLRVDVGAGLGTPCGQTFGVGFKTIALTNVIADTASGWNAGASTYTAPATGTYLIVSNVRLMDGAPANISYGQGVNTSNVDNNSFIWKTTGSLRNGFTNTRIMQLSAGQTVDLFLYVDSPNPVQLSSASLSIQQLQ